ncbi:MAG: hypothetical protein K2X49_19885 [Acetobacteraceae bacterium]|nr:hypothetical protein [Acetobacteraceae bacterium]
MLAPDHLAGREQVGAGEEAVGRQVQEGHHPRGGTAAIGPPVEDVGMPHVRCHQVHGAEAVAMPADARHEARRPLAGIGLADVCDAGTAALARADVVQRDAAEQRHGGGVQGHAVGFRHILADRHHGELDHAGARRPAGPEAAHLLIEEGRNLALAIGGHARIGHRGIPGGPGDDARGATVRAFLALDSGQALALVLGHPSADGARSHQSADTLARRIAQLRRQLGDTRGPLTDLPIKDFDFDLLRQCFNLITEYEGRTGNKLQGNQLREVALRLFVQMWSSARTLRRGEDSEAAERRAEAEGRQMLELLIAAASPGTTD